jgi:hypothetical protein
MHIIHAHILPQINHCQTTFVPRAFSGDLARNSEYLSYGECGAVWGRPIEGLPTKLRDQALDASMVRPTSLPCARPAGIKSPARGAYKGERRVEKWMNRPVGKGTGPLGVFGHRHGASSGKAVKIGHRFFPKNCAAQKSPYGSRRTSGSRVGELSSTRSHFFGINFPVDCAEDL